MRKNFHSSVLFPFPALTKEIKDLLIRDLDGIGVVVKRDSFDRVVKCLDRVAGGQNG